MLTLFRGIIGTEGSGGTLFFVTTEEYAKPYYNNISSFAISRLGHKRLLNEGIIETKSGINASNGASGAEVAVPNRAVQSEILKRINPTQ